MDLVLKSIRNKLAEDPTLTEIVSAYDITTGYNVENANYPCVLLGISSGGAGTQIANTAKAVLTINVYSSVGKQQLWTIYSRIKTLIHNNELGITDAQRTFHAINEIFVDENKYDKTHSVWQITAKYNVLFGTSGLSLTTGVNGAIYADRNSVIANPEKEIAKFRGPVRLNILFDHDVRMSQERFGKAVYYKSGTAKLTIGEVIFKPSVLELLWNIDTNINDKLNDSVTPSTTYQLGQCSSPAYIQVLFQMLKTDDGKKLEIEASKAVCHNLTIPFSKKDFSVFNCEWILLSDNNDNVVKVSIEN
jgi:hypothetical protein